MDLRERIEQALGKIASLALNGMAEYCPGCHRKLGYLFFASDIRNVLKELVDVSGPGAVYVQTGNACDILFDYVGKTKVLIGIKPRDGAFIPLPNPEDFLAVFEKIMKECQESREKNELPKISGS